MHTDFRHHPAHVRWVFWIGAALLAPGRMAWIVWDAARERIGEWRRR